MCYRYQFPLGHRRWPWRYLSANGTISLGLSMEKALQGEKSTVTEFFELIAPLTGSPPVALASPRVSVVIPALNEARNLPYVLARLPDDIFEVILVDGRSIDDTVSVARKCLPAIRVLEQAERGKGNALACGFAAAKGDVIVMLDADGSAKPEEIPRFIDALRSGADFAKGTRFAPGGGSADITTLRKSGNMALVSLVNKLFRTSYTDLCYGFNAFWVRCLPSLDVDCDGFEVETLINIRAARAGLRVAEVPSFERGRMHGVSNLNAWSDGLRVLRTVLSEYLSPRSFRALNWSELGDEAAVEVVRKTVEIMHG